MGVKLEETELFSHILSVSRRMAEEHGLPSLLPYVMNEVLQLIDAERGVIVLKKCDGTLDFKVARDQAGNDLTVNKSELSQFILAQMRQSEPSIVLRDAVTYSGFREVNHTNQQQLHSTMYVPLITKNNVIGAIYIENSHTSKDQSQFQEADVAPLELLAYQFAVTIAR